MARGLPFAKLHGAGNAYLAVDARARELDLPALAKEMTAHHTGVGSDGLVVAQAARDASAAIRLRILNSDGSEAEMSGNGVRLFAKFVLDRGFASLDDDASLRVETAAGLRRVWPELRGGVMVAGRVGMAVPSFAPADLPMSTDHARWVDRPLELPSAPGGELRVTCLSLGNPHAVHVTGTPVEQFPLAELGEQVQHHPRFPQRVNFEVVNVIGPTRLRARIYERGEGETPSSGTGSTACAVAAQVLGYTEGASRPGASTSVRSSPKGSTRSHPPTSHPTTSHPTTSDSPTSDSAARTAEPVHVELPGGVLSIAWRGEGTEAFLDGPTVEIFSGEWRGAQALR